MNRSPAPESTAPLRIAGARGRWTLLATVLGSGVVLLGSTVTNIALPRIGQDFDADLGVLQWTVNAYMLTLAGLILLGGSLGDRFGRRRIFVLGLVWFAVASLLCAVAPDTTTLIAARALQGVGGALLTPGSLAIIEASFHPDDRPRAIGLWSGFGGIGAALGPFVGGWLVDGPGWRWTFVLSAVPALLCVPVALRHVPESMGAPRREAVSTAGAGARRGVGFDVPGAVLGALALALVTYALTEARDGGTVAVAAAVGGVVAGAAFLRVERRSGDPMMPLAIFSSRQFTAVNVITLCVYAGTGGFFFLTALQLQIVVGYSALAAGAAMLPNTVLMLLFSSHAGMLAQRLGPRAPLTVGPLVCGAGMLLMLRVGPGASYLQDIFPALLVMGARHGRHGRSPDRDPARLGGRLERRTGQWHQQRRGPGGGAGVRRGSPAAGRDGPGGLPVGHGLRRLVRPGHAAVRGPPRRRRDGRLRHAAAVRRRPSSGARAHPRLADGTAAGVPLRPSSSRRMTTGAARSACRTKGTRHVVPVPGAEVLG
ncbi:EmrB/QacA subfamily drug resistance transporter [Streptomyces ambofaciens]